MKIFNTLTQSVEPFTPLGDTVLAYVCGITPYDTTHLGHAFTYVSFDTLFRYLEYRDYKVRYVQNVTDIDDDVLRKAGQLGIAWDELEAHFENLYYQTGRPAKPIRLMLSLLILKQLYNLSDEAIVKRSGEKYCRWNKNCHSYSTW